jgi:hypothetical protein
MSSKIGSDNVIVIPKLLSNPVPVSTMISASMDQDHWRGFWVTPVHVVKPKPLRKISM